MIIGRHSFYNTPGIARAMGCQLSARSPNGTGTSGSSRRYEDIGVHLEESLVGLLKLISPTHSTISRKK